jgi:RHS repeat-associated protein
MRMFLKDADFEAFGRAIEKTLESRPMRICAYGKLSQTDSSYAPTFSYTGRQYDAAVDLYYCRARWYDAGTGGFISEDPLGFGGGDANLARYCGNSPTNFTDPAEDRTKNGANAVGSE